MSIGTYCTPRVVTILERASIEEASRLMRDHHVGSLVVVDKLEGKQAPKGIITDRDLALCLGTEINPGKVEIKRIMHSNPVVVNGRDSLMEALTKMREHGVKRLPVVDDFGALCGLVSADDLVEILARELFTLAKITERQMSKEKGVDIPSTLTSASN